jgi:hypothetical protein
MTSLRARTKLCFVLAAALITLNLPSSIAEEARSRPLKLPGLRVLGSGEGTSQNLGQPQPDGEAVPHQSFAGPQRLEQRDQTSSPGITAPGSDMTRFVPGTTVGGFNQAGAFTLGRILLKPSAVVSYSYESNLQALSKGYQSDTALIVSPTIEAFLPVTRNGIRLEYTLLFRNYQNLSITQNFDHTFNADSEFDLSPGMSLAVRDHFSMSSIDAREFVPGREVVFSDSPFRRNDLGMQLSWALSENDKLAINGNWNHVFFDNATTDKEVPFYGYNQMSYGGTYKRDLSERFAIFGNTSYHQNRTGDPRNLANSKGFGIEGGIDGSLTPLISGQFSAGIQWDSYPGASQQAARGVVFRGAFSKEISERSQMMISLSRSTNLSYFQQNAYFTSTGIGGSYTRELGPKLIVSISPGYQRNGYPTLLQSGPGVPSDLVGKSSRSDSFVDFDLSVRYRYNDWLAMDARFGIAHRNSDIPDFRFNSYRWGINFLIGSRGSTTGRSPY